MSAGVSAPTLVFEIDESDVLGRPEPSARFASSMKSIGVGLAIDGFARRSVSFAPLKILKVDYVKVDGSIVRQLLKSEVARTKMGAILRVSEALKIGIIAECVEEQDILLRLKALGVGYAQGFGVYQPHAIEAIAAVAAPSA
jgi:EAL domain-containing protein (putative c-di-GMP-specific phosphodiesterase class I)